jgi:hypothetical protein
MSEPWYDRETHTYYGSADSYGQEPDQPFGTFIMFIGLVGTIAWLLSKVFSRSVFTSREEEAFKRAAEMNKEVKRVQELVSPSMPKPDYSVTVGVNTPKKS